MLADTIHSDACHKASGLEEIFAEKFYSTYKTRLVGGAAEPLYTPAVNADENSRICYREDFFSSALHEISHWCIAGDKRRLQEDFGYWYVEDGRSDTDQAAFESVEVKPQALELLFSLAANYRFQVSVDNLNGSTNTVEQFQQSVFKQALRYCNNGLPHRASIFFKALREHYKGLSITEITELLKSHQVANPASPLEQI
ncbi:MAG: elongation factor P hydroxylase [Pseudomonadales bacterium]